MPSISVILPVFNAERFVSASIASILAQTVRDLEVIVIDDGSTDGSREAVLRTAGNDSRVTVVSRENRGLVASLNEGIDRAQSPRIARMDADDLALPLRFERQMVHMERTRTNVCGTWAMSIGTGRSRLLRHPVSDAGIRTELLFGSCFIHPSVMMTTPLARALRYREEMTRCEDYDLWERAAADGHSMANVPEALICYRLHPGQESQRHQALQSELAQAVRRRAWVRFLSRENADLGLADDVVSIRAAGLAHHNVGRIHTAFRLLLASTSDEARRVALDHIRRLYFRLAGRHPEIPRRWADLVAEFGGMDDRRWDWGMNLVGALHLNPELPAFSRAKHWYKSWLN